MMKKIFYKNKILINGLFPIIGFKIDGYIQKTKQYDETIINAEHEDFPFYSFGYLTQSAYSVQGKTGIFYECFENIELFEMEVESTDDIDALNELLISEIGKKVSLLEKKLRLITNINVGLPIFLAYVFDENQNLITRIGEIQRQPSCLPLNQYTEKMKATLVNRLRFHIADETLNDLEERNVRYKRAMEFYIHSFVPTNKSLRFVLLFSSLESLFNTDGEAVTTTIAEYGSKILFLDSKHCKKMQRKLTDYYDIRSTYIHGNNPRPITEKNEFDLREIVREILLIYWMISISQNIYDAKQMMSFLDSTKVDKLDITVQLFKKSLHVTDYESLYGEVIQKLIEGKTNILFDE